MEKWEFYPDDVAAVPVLLLVPDTATADTPAPLVLCFTGSLGNKEYIADEPNLPREACNIDRYPERNRMGKYFVKNGMIAACFDPLGMGELSLDPDDPGRGWHSRTAFTHLMLMQGYNFTGVSARNAFCFLDFLITLPIVDGSRVAVSGHFLGTEVAINMAIVPTIFTRWCSTI